MRLFLFDWFGWSLLWMLPLCGRVLFSLLAGPGLRGRGSIRIWLGALLLLCASSAIEAMLRKQGGNTLDSALLGQALARGMSAVCGKLASVLIMLAMAALGGWWMFGRKRHTEDSAEAAPSMPAPLMRTPSAKAAADGRPLPEVRHLTRPRRDPWPWPDALSTSSAGTGAVRHGLGKHAGQASNAGKWPQPPAAEMAEKRPARPASEWETFESLRPTPAMLARARAQEVQAAGRQSNQIRHPGLPQILPTAPAASVKPALAQHVLNPTKPIPAVPGGTKVRISSASDRSNAIPTSLRHALNAHAPLAPSAAPPSQTPLATPAATALIARLPEPVIEPLAPVALTAAAPPATASVPAAALTAELPELAVPPAPLHIINESEAVVPRTLSAAPSPADPTSIAPPRVQQAAPAVMEVAAATGVPAAAAPAAPVRHWQQAAVTAAAAAMAESLPARMNQIPLPGLELLDQGNDTLVPMDAAQLEEVGQLIEQRLREFKVPVTVLGAYAGPVITRFEIEPALGVRGAQIVNLMKDLARALGLTSIRVVETIPGKTCMGLELPNPKRQMIRLAEIIRAAAYTGSASHLTLAMGKDITGVPVATDLARAPHMLVAGTTGSGKSVAINAMILSLLYKATPDDVRLIMIDPKMLELSVYDGIPHLLAPVVTDMKLAAHALSWCVAEMDKRYRLMSALGVRNLAGYNQKINDGIAAGKLVRNPFSLTPDAPEPLERLPMIVVVIDELADLMMVAGKKIEELIARLAQKARAAGIHLILATQRPSVDVITGLIKANIPTRVAFQVSSKIDSRTVLDQMGAETLLGHGDMLFLPPGSGYPQRVHGAFVSDEEVHRVVEHLKAHGEPQYEAAILAGPALEEVQQGDMFGDAGDDSDPLYDEAVAWVTRSRRASISAVQRQFRIGYNRAARLVEQMEASGILSSMSKSGSRDVLAPPPPDL